MAEGRGSRNRSSSRLSILTGSSLSLNVPFTRDVFVACADKDQEVVKSRVIQPLESREITCCYAQRDFIPGHSESQSAVKFMKTSRKTIVVLSKNFKGYRLSHTILGLTISNQLPQGSVIPVKIDDDTDMDGRFRDVVTLDMTAVDETTFITKLEKAVVFEERSSGSFVDVAAPPELYTPESTPSSEISTPSSETSSGSSTGNTDLHQELDEGEVLHSTAIMNAEDAVARFNDLDRNDPYYKYQERHHLKAVAKTTSLHTLAHFSCSQSQVVADKALEKLQDFVSSCMGHCDPDTYLEELRKSEAILRGTINKKGQSAVIIKRRMLRLKTCALIVYQLGILLDKGDIDLENNFFTAVNDFSKIDFKTCKNKGLVASYTVQFAQSAAKYTQDISKRKEGRCTYVEKLAHLVESQKEGTYKELLKSLCEITTDKKKNFSTEVFLHILKKKVMRVKDASTIFLDVLQKMLDAILKNKKIEKVCRSGLLLVGTQILVHIASNHANPGIREQVVNGSYQNNMAGLRQLWNYEDKKWQEVASEVFELCTPLCFMSKDEAVVRAVADRFLTETSTSRERSTEEIPYQNDPQLDQTKMLPVLMKSIKHHLYEEGLILTVSESQPSSGATLSINGRMSDMDVLIKVTRHSTREDLVSKDLSPDGLRNEIRVLGRMNHPNVIKVLAAHDGPSPPSYLITPREQEVTLIDYVIGLRRSVPTDVIVLLVDACRQIAEAVIYLSTKAKVVHRDIMAKNCLCRVLPNGKMHCCLTNFELSRTMKKCGREARQGTKYECPGNPEDPISYRWSAPESLTQDIFTSASEVWMLACLIYEVLTLGVHPFPECEDPRRMKDYLNAGERTEQPSCLSKLDEKSRIYQFLWMCWSADPGDRPSPEDVRTFLEKTAKRHSKGDFSHVFVSPPTVRAESIVRRSCNTSQAINVATENTCCSNQSTGDDDSLSICQPLYYDPVAPDIPESTPYQTPRLGSPTSDMGEYDDTIQQPRVQTGPNDPPIIDQPLYMCGSPVSYGLSVTTPNQTPPLGGPTGDADDYDDTIHQTSGYQALRTSQYQTLGAPGAQATASQASRTEGATTHPQPGHAASDLHLRQGARPRPFRARTPSENEDFQPRGRLQTEPTRPNPRVRDPRMIQSEIFYI
uniref:TIRA n=1 Tax=Branchiostoma belcheri tsingtauense TaxID=155462 RepID=A0A0A0U990_BRABE|nr:TIRA [Branchiostoma belcheri tsingtauense]